MEEYLNKLPPVRLRTINQAAELKEKDKNSAVSPYLIRQFILNNEIPSVKSGAKYLVEMSVLESYLRGQYSNQDKTFQGIRSISESSEDISSKICMRKLFTPTVK